jgi:hypothetical protein
LLTITSAERPVFAQTTPADRLKAIEAIYPPWRHGDRSDVADRGFEFTVPPADVLADFHGILDNPQLVLFAFRQLFLCLGEPVTAFGDTNPQYRGRVRRPPLASRPRMARFRRLRQRFQDS